MTHSYVWHDIYTCDITHSCVWHDMLMRVTWLIHACDRHIHIHDMTHSCTWHDVFMCDKAHAHLRYDSFVHVTKLIHVCDIRWEKAVRITLFALGILLVGRLGYRHDGVVSLSDGILLGVYTRWSRVSLRRH